MTEFILLIAISNTAFALLLAVLAIWVSRKLNRHRLGHFLWILVFLKLVTPPLITLPGIGWESQSRVATIEHESSPEMSALEQAPVVAHPANNLHERKAESNGTINLLLTSRMIGQASLLALRPTFPWLVGFWTIGSVFVLLVSLNRACRFNRLVTANSFEAPEAVLAEASLHAKRLKLRAAPEIRVTDCNLSPLVWWFGRRTRIFVPQSMLDGLPRHQWTWVIAHELAHVKRLDHFVRWLEWVACVVFWWNPMVWWAQRQLRISEEICCDALVISSAKSPPKQYAKSILQAVQILANPALRPPAMASEINSGGVLERRFTMMMNNRERRMPSRWLKVVSAVLAMLILPLGLASAQDFEKIAKRLKKAVKKGEITGDQADVMMSALKKSEGKKSKTETNPFSGQEIKDRKAKYHAVMQKIEEAVKAGKLSKQDAEKKLVALKKELFNTAGGKDNRKKNEHDQELVFQKIVEEVKRAVEAGKLSREDAHRKLSAIKEKMFGKDRHGEHSADDRHGHDDESAHSKTGDFERSLKVRSEHFAKEVEAKVKAGKMSKEEAKKAMEGFRRRVATAYREHQEQERVEKERDDKNKVRARESDRVPSIDALRRRLEEGMKSGRISKEQAAEAIQQYKRRMEQMKRNRAEDKADGEQPGTRARTLRGADLESVKRRLEESVRSGRLSKEQAKESLEAVRRRLHELGKNEQKSHEIDEQRQQRANRIQLDGSKFDLDAVRKKIEEGVKSGKISKERAKQILAELDKQLKMSLEKSRREESQREKKDNDG